MITEALRRRRYSLNVRTWMVENYAFQSETGREIIDAGKDVCMYVYTCAINYTYIHTYMSILFYSFLGQFWGFVLERYKIKVIHT